MSALEEALQVTLRVTRTLRHLGVSYVVDGSEDLLVRALDEAGITST